MYYLKTPPLLYTLRSTVKCTIEEVRVRGRCLVLGSTPQSAYIRVWKEKVFHCSGNRLWYMLYMFSLIVISRGSGYPPFKLLLTL